MKPITLTRLLRTRDAMESIMFATRTSGRKPRVQVAPRLLQRYRAVCRAICDMCQAKPELTP